MGTSAWNMGDEAPDEDQAMAQAIALSMQQENGEADAQQEDNGPVQMQQQMDSGPVQMMQQMDSGPVQQMDGGMENYGGAGNRFCSATMGGSCSFQGDGPDAKCSSCQMTRAEKEGPAEQQPTEQHHVYHERQEAALCAMHCINNLLQSPCCTVVPTK